MYCKLCGRKKRWLERFKDVPVKIKDVEEGYYCPECYDKVYPKLLVDCVGCAYLEETGVLDGYGSPVGLIWKCNKLNITVDDVRDCILKRTQEQLTKGISPTEPKLAVCKYCHTQYDSNAQLNCPNCGAYPKKR